MLIDKFDATQGWGKWYIKITDWLLMYCFNLQPFNSGCPQFHLSYLALIALPFVALFKGVKYLFDLFWSYVERKNDARRIAWMQSAAKQLKLLPKDVFTMVRKSAVAYDHYGWDDVSKSLMFCEPELKPYRKYISMWTRYDRSEHLLPQSERYTTWANYEYINLSDVALHAKLYARIVARKEEKDRKREVEIGGFKFKDSAPVEQAPAPAKPVKPFVPLNKRLWWPSVVLWSSRIVGTIITIIAVLAGLALLYYLGLVAQKVLEYLTNYIPSISWSTTWMFWKGILTITGLGLLGFILIAGLAFVIVYIAPFLVCPARKVWSGIKLLVSPLKYLVYVALPFMFLGSLIAELFGFLVMAGSMFYRNNCPPIIRTKEDLEQWNESHKPKTKEMKNV